MGITSSVGATAAADGERVCPGFGNGGNGGSSEVGSFVSLFDESPVEPLSRDLGSRREGDPFDAITEDATGGAGGEDAAGGAGGEDAAGGAGGEDAAGGEGGETRGGIIEGIPRIVRFWSPPWPDELDPADGRRLPQ